MHINYSRNERTMETIFNTSHIMKENKPVALISTKFDRSSLDCNKCKSRVSETANRTKYIF